MENRRILWICNLMPGFVGRMLGEQGTNKEGWIEGIFNMIVEDDCYELGIAFPTNDGNSLNRSIDGIRLFGFVEDTNNTDRYDSGLESALGAILEDYSPDVIHVFGTEYPHCLALLRLKEWRDRIVIHLQGLLRECETVYEAGLPADIVERATFRDFIKHDSIKEQREKFAKRAKREEECLQLVEYVLGRTEFDRNYIHRINSKAQYYLVNESLRPPFYDTTWDRSKAVCHRIFISQGNYPLKGAHYMIEALAIIRRKYKDATLVVGGDNIIRQETLKDKLKLSSYGKYLLELIKDNDLKDAVTFTGPLSAEQMLENYQSCEVFVLPSVIENSPNSLGEAMLLGVPAVATRVGGVPSLCDDGKEAILCNSFDYAALADAVLYLFDNQEIADKLGRCARNRALLTHDRVANYKMLLWVYEDIIGKRR